MNLEYGVYGVGAVDPSYSHMSGMGLDVPQLTVSQLKDALRAGVLLIDLRPHELFASSHIPGSINVVFSRKSLPERVATAIPPGSPFVLLSEDENITAAAVEALARIDRNPLYGTASEGVRTWCRAGLTPATLAQLPVPVLWQHLNAGRNELLLIDVREPFEWEWGHIEGSLLIPLGEIWRRAGSLDPHKNIVLICQEGLRSSTAASILLHHKFPRISNVAGGMGHWLNAAYPTIRPPKR